MTRYVRIPDDCPDGVVPDFLSKRVPYKLHRDHLDMDIICGDDGYLVPVNIAPEASPFLAGLSGFIECHADGTPLVEATSEYLNQPKRSEADVRAAAEAVKQAALDNRLSRGEPSEYWINVFWNRKHGRIETDTNHTALCDVYDEINDGYPSCDYLHTVYVRKVGSDRTVQTQYLEDDARRWSNG